MPQTPDERLRTTSLPALIYERLREEIRTGALKPGALRLRPLAERFGTSQIPIREALRRLEAEGLVSFDGHRKITVNSISGQEVDEIFSIRAELESLALRKAAPRLSADPERLAQLDALIKRLDAEIDRPDQWRTTNEELHTLIYEAAQSPRLLAMIRTLWVAVEPSLRMYVTSTPSLVQAQEQHRAMVNFLRRGDGASAESVLRVHLASTLHVVSTLMDEAAAAPDDGPDLDVVQ